MLTSEDYIKASTRKWEELAARPDIVGKKIEYRSGRSIEAEGKISRIEVGNGRVSIYCSDDTSSPFKEFAIDKENGPSGINRTIFADLDDDSRNLQIHL
ncbi:MAG: hypothetical protein V4436_00815 [Patescibacteria group bacterium]